MMVTLVPQHLIDAVWPSVATGFEKASRRGGGDLTVGELWQGCRQGTCFLFVVHDDNHVKAATVWKPELWTSGPKFRCLALFGNGVWEWKDMLREHVERTAKMCGATSLLSEGRVGWQKVFPEAKVLRVVYEAKI